MLQKYRTCDKNKQPISVHVSRQFDEKKGIEHFNGKIEKD